MAGPMPLPPHGFDELSAEQRVNYVQSLRDHIAADEDGIPVADWHTAVLRQRLRDQETQPDDTLDWDGLRDKLERLLEDRDPEE